MDRTIEKRVEYFVILAGIFGRNRTVKRHVADVAEVPADAPLTDDAALALAQGVIAGLKCKPGTRWYLKRNGVEIEHYPAVDEYRPAWTCRRTLPFDAVTIASGEVA